MGFIRNLLRNREKSQLEEAILKDPSPSAYLRLARMYQEEGDLTRAAQIAKRGAAKFPEHAEMGSAGADLGRLDREAECKRLRERIENYPNPRLYSRLAELLRASGEVDEARNVVDRGLRNYPDYGGLHYVLGQMASDAGEQEEAVKQLQLAVDQDEYNYAALKLLGQTYAQLGRHGEAAETYTRILAFAPDDADVKALRGDALAASGGAEASRQVSPSMDTKVMSTQEAAAGIAVEKARAESAAAPDKETRVRPAGAAVEGDLTPAIGELAASAGIEGAVLVDNYGLPVASDLPGGMEEALAAAMATGLRRSAGPACGEMGLGSFDEIVVESTEGSIYVYALREMTLAVFAERGAKAGMVERCVQGFAEKALEQH